MVQLSVIGLQRHIFGDDFHVAHNRRVEDLRIAARHVDIGMAEHLGDVINRRAAGQCQGCERMAQTVEQNTGSKQMKG